MQFRRRLAMSLGASAGATLAAVAFTRNRERLDRVRRSMRTSSAPGARWYELLFDRVLGGFFERVAGDVAGAVADVETPRVLEIGPGPGGLALRLVERLPNLHLVGLDIDPAMVERASARAAAAGHEDRARFRVGDVSALPFDDESFDLVVSTFSVHHWERAEEGFGEIRRVLRPGGRALIYDLPDRWGRFEAHARPLADVAAAAFPGVAPRRVPWPGRISLVSCLAGFRLS
jgi:ubiquinone/menaquinone biosynthesis C-methylase UbiE